MRWVPDASVVIPFLLDEDMSPAARSFFIAAETCTAPSLLRLEVTNVLWKAVRRNFLDAEGAIQAAAQFEAMGIILSDAPVDAGQLLALSLELNHPAYDCAYLIHAAIEDAQLVTLDEKFLLALEGSPWKRNAVYLSDVLRHH